MIQARASRWPCRTRGSPVRHRSTCVGHQLAIEGWSTGRPIGDSSSTLAIRSPLEFELDPDLELIKVEGPAVRGYRIKHEGTARRLEVTFGGDLQSTTRLQFFASARVPLEGRWNIPAIVPQDVVWTGGNTTVILDELHKVEECNEAAGSRIVKPQLDSGPDERLVFESESPRSVAQLVFKKPRAESSCAVRGQLFITGSPCRLETRAGLDVSSGDRFRAGSRPEPGMGA